MTTSPKCIVTMTVVALLISASSGGLSAMADAQSVGVVQDPCARVPIEPTPAHNSATNSYASWMNEWLGVDWGQRCRYRDENAALPPPSGSRIVFLGDSITEGWKRLDPGFFESDILDRGISGQTTAQMLVRFRADVLELHPTIVHIMAGTNDIAGNTGPTSLAIIQGNIMSMVEQAGSHGILIILGAIPPTAHFSWRPDIQPIDNIGAMNSWLRVYARREHVEFVDYYSVLSDGHGGFRPTLTEDGVHPNAAGYAVMQPLARAAIARALARAVLPHRCHHKPCDHGK